MKKTVLLICIIYGVIASYAASAFYIETLAYTAPQAAKRDLSEIAAKDADSLTEDDYRFIYVQTGLGKAAVDSLKSLDELYDYQESYYSEPEFKCSMNSPVSFEERITGNAVKLAPLEDGDILVTNSSHVLSWRNGHTAIVASAEKEITLEAVVIGKNSKTQNLSKWTGYPNFAVLRLKNADKEERSKIAEYAMEHLNNIPYNVFVGIYPAKYSAAGKAAGTQCAHLVWLAYAAYGYDIDSNRGLIVTPKDILNSGLFEVVQTYGMG